jgi:hypothetical protein
MSGAIFTEFTPSDWWSFCGAERWPDGGAPFLGECEVKNTDGACVLVDANGIFILPNYPDDEPAGPTEYQLRISLTRDAALALARGLFRVDGLVVDQRWLAAHGFTATN